MTNTVIGVYDSFAHAQSAMQKLLASGFTASEVHMQPQADTAEARVNALRAVGGAATANGDRHAEPGYESGTLRSFFREMFGGARETDHADHYAEAVRRGSFVLAVDARDAQQRDIAADLMEQFNPIDIDERASRWQAGGWSQHDVTAAPLNDDEVLRERDAYTARTGVAPGADSRQATIPVMAEQLEVGKRAVQRGGVRVFQRVVETPVQETVTLREEHVTVDRHAVDQPATARNLDAFKEESFELREMAEEAVVAKTARVVEEVVIGKEVTEKQATISDTVRRTDVEVEQLGTGKETVRDINAPGVNPTSTSGGTQR